MAFAKQSQSAPLSGTVQSPNPQQLEGFLPHHCIFSKASSYVHTASSSTHCLAEDQPTSPASASLVFKTSPNQCAVAGAATSAPLAGDVPPLLCHGWLQPDQPLGLWWGRRSGKVNVALSCPRSDPTGSGRSHAEGQWSCSSELWSAAGDSPRGLSSSGLRALSSLHRDCAFQGTLLKS